MKKYKNPLRLFMPFLGILAVFFGTSFSALAQANTTEAPQEKAFSMIDWISSLSLEQVILLLLVAVFVLILLYFVNVIQSMIEILKVEVQERERIAGIAPKPKKPSLYSQIMQKLTDAKTVEEAPDILLDHEYDGIQELDNSLPPWWKWMFYLTIIWSVLYVVNYHMVPIWDSGNLQAAEYDNQIEEGKRQLEEYKLKSADFVDETTVTMPTDAAIIAKGKVKFDEVCAACHGAQGQGEVGPNLTDEYWLHGGDIQSVFKSIKYGIPEKGMISWQDQLKPSEMQAISGYILTLQGTNPNNAKEPQGELYKPAAVNGNEAPVDSTISQ